ncbi:hypothetical protein L6R29_03080 [Myxococcota bacterium]|nr:hypothetical protein [Myxococcota bacterium]
MTRYRSPAFCFSSHAHPDAPVHLKDVQTAIFRGLWIFIVWCVLFGLLGCRPILRTQEQLQGAPPARDLLAAYVLDQLQTHPAKYFSVGGVRLGDPKERVEALWGKPSRQTGDRSTWGDADGNPLYSVLWKEVVTRVSAQSPPKRESLVVQIDLFPACSSVLHPDNRVLLSEAIRQSAVRQKLFAAIPFPQHTRLAKRFFYLQRGWAVVLFSELIPSQQKIPYVVRLFLETPTTPLRQGTSQAKPTQQPQTHVTARL